MANGAAGDAALARASEDPAETAKFDAMAASWWDPEGAFRPLHQLNPVRLRFIKDTVCDHLERDHADVRAFDGLRLADIGCGGGLLAEPMARLGAAVTAVDASERNIAIARQHAQDIGLHIDYRRGTAEMLVDAGETFDVVLNLEVVEHVADLDAFLGACCQLLRPNGVMILSTINRTRRAYLLAIVGAEYVLRWLPRGTHQWHKFVRPAELRRGLRANGVDMVQAAGMVYDPLRDAWRLSAHNLAVNYLAVGTKR